MVPGITFGTLPKTEKIGVKSFNPADTPKNPRFLIVKENPFCSFPTSETFNERLGAVFKLSSLTDPDI